eukprot:1917829-Pyramimonas_sp.AAC.1
MEFPSRAAPDGRQPEVPLRGPRGTSRHWMHTDRRDEHDDIRAHLGGHSRGMPHGRAHADSGKSCLGYPDSEV